MKNNSFIDDFEKVTGLKLVEQFGGSYNECSGATYGTIISKIHNFNQQSKRIKAYAFNDSKKDCTIISFIKE